MHPKSNRPIRRATSYLSLSLERFFRLEAASGVVLVTAAAAALIWANSPWTSSYDQFWGKHIIFKLGRFTSSESIQFWVNEGLMTLFFFVVGLEIRHELRQGELANRKQAILPLVAAVGGMIVPALIFAITTATTHEFRRGWGIPTATDIAFAVGVLALLGRRVPKALRVLILTLAIIDDLGAILVIAIFYASGGTWLGLLTAIAAFSFAFVLRWLGVVRFLAYAPLGVLIWFGLERAGIHPTMAGVLLAFALPAKAGDQSSGVQLLTKLQPWVAYAIMPIFALANAGVNLSTRSSQNSWPLYGGIVLGLVVGKPAGVILATWLAAKLRIAELPHGVSYRGILLIGSVAGIGFTMAIFIAGLAFHATEQLMVAKRAILLASVTAACLSLLLGAYASPAAKAEPNERR